MLSQEMYTSKTYSSTSQAFIQFLVFFIFLKNFLWYNRMLLRAFQQKQKVQFLDEEHAGMEIIKKLGRNRWPKGR